MFLNAIQIDNLPEYCWIPSFAHEYSFPSTLSQTIHEMRYNYDQAMIETKQIQYLTTMTEIT